MSKIYTVVGNRPQFIKLDSNLPNQYVIHSGQHYDYEMSQKFFRELQLPKPYINLNCKSEQSGMMYQKLLALFTKDKPNIVLVYGDTLTTLMAAMAGKMAKVKVVHVESGCRSFDIKMPEELSRVITDRIADIHFTTTRECQKNLQNEGVLYKTDLYLQGDPMFDAMNKFLPLKRKNYQKYILLTIHRDFNADSIERLKSILGALGEFNFPIKFPVHPRTKRLLKKVKIPKNITLLKPVGYKEMLGLESNALKIVTDSGGVQREAYWMRIPCLILRENTEWNYTIQDKWAVLVDADKEKILDSLRNFNPDSRQHQSEFPLFGVHEKVKNQLYKFL